MPRQPPGGWPIRHLGDIAAAIGAAYWFTSSTSFANPAVTIRRVFSDTFAGDRFYVSSRTVEDLALPGFVEGEYRIGEAFEPSLPRSVTIARSMLKGGDHPGGQVSTGDRRRMGRA